MLPGDLGVLKFKINDPMTADPGMTRQFNPLMNFNPGRFRGTNDNQVPTQDVTRYRNGWKWNFWFDDWLVSVVKRAGSFKSLISCIALCSRPGNVSVG